MANPEPFRGKSTPFEMSARYTLFRRLMILLGRLFFGFTVHGVENVPKTGAMVIAANHRHYADPVLVCMAVPRRMQWMAKKQLFVGPFGRFFEFIGSFAVDREGGGRGGLRSALAFLEAGWPLGIFPEGTHRDDGTAREAKSGAIMLAIRGEVPILPVHVGPLPGLRDRLKGARHHVHVGNPIYMDNTLRGGKAYREAADKVLRRIYALPKEIPSKEKR